MPWSCVRSMPAGSADFGWSDIEVSFVERNTAELQRPCPAGLAMVIATCNPRSAGPRIPRYAAWPAGSPRPRLVPAPKWLIGLHAALARSLLYSHSAQPTKDTSMSPPDEDLSAIDPALLDAVTGGTDTNDQITQALQNIQSTI